MLQTSQKAKREALGLAEEERCLEAQSGVLLGTETTHLLEATSAQLHISASMFSCIPVSASCLAGAHFPYGCPRSCSQPSLFLENTKAEQVFPLLLNSLPTHCQVLPLVLFLLGPQDNEGLLSDRICSFPLAGFLMRAGSSYNLQADHLSWFKPNSRSLGSAFQWPLLRKQGHLPLCSLSSWLCVPAV